MGTLRAANAKEHLHSVHKMLGEITGNADILRSFVAMPGADDGYHAS